MTPRRLLFLIPIIIIVGLLFFFSRGLKQDPRLLPSTLVNHPAPSFKLLDLTGKQSFDQTIFLNHYSLFNVWASWCETCQEEQAYLLQLKQQYPQLQIIGLNYKDQTSAAKTWLKKHGNPYQIILADTNGNTAIDYGVYGTPETFLINPAGIIIAKHVGTLDQQAFNQEFLPQIPSLATGVSLRGA